ncbi:MAG TPA: DUF2135 domain-containing protein [Byssovorax sp.]|jgi:tetratricopeptide (TPR) repeat protein
MQSRLPLLALAVALAGAGLAAGALATRGAPPAVAAARTFGARAAAIADLAGSATLEAPASQVAPTDAPKADAPPSVGPITAGALTLTPLETEPKEGEKAPTDHELDVMRGAIAQAPKDRAARFKLVRALMRGNKLDDALAEARAWRERDAYNLVVVRLEGDILAALGRRSEARRVYSAVVELLPRDTDAQRALATVLKQSGDLAGAYDRLRAAASATTDLRTSFELADVAQRLGRASEAADRFTSIIGAEGAHESIRYPAKQRLAQIRAGERRAAIARGDADEARRIGAEIDALAVKGGVENDVKIYLTWDTDRSDVDLHVITPTGEEVDYRKKQASTGEALFDDVTSGYGPESFTAKRAHPGRYLVRVNYFGTSRQTFTEARGEVTVILHEGGDDERKVVLPYKLFSPKQTVEVAAIDVGEGALALGRSTKRGAKEGAL